MTVAYGSKTNPLSYSRAGGGVVTSPAGANTIIASTGSLAVGLHEVFARWSISGTAEVLPLNIRILPSFGNPTINPLPSLPGTYELTFTMEITGVGSAFIQSVAAGTVGAVYAGIICATQIA